MIYRLLVISALLFSASLMAEDNIKPFATDGCSAFPDGTLGHQSLWLSCCTAHDFSYWKGGTYEERIIADQALKACVEQVGEPTIAALMLAGVRVGGSPYLPTEFRWGYGWPYPRGYREISAGEHKLIEQVLMVEQILKTPFNQ